MGLRALKKHADVAIADGKATAQSGTVPFAAYSAMPVEFIKEVLGVGYLTPEQEHICLSVRDRRITNVQAAHGVGKSFISACILLWHVFAAGGLCITSAPTEDQVKEILWMEVRRLYDANKSKLGGDRGMMFVRLTETARAYGFTSRDYSSDSFQGKHGIKLLLILDESNGITEEIDDGARSCATGSQNRLLRIGNPLSHGTPFQKACASSNVSISVWTHPNVAWAYDTQHRLRPEIARDILLPNGEVKPTEEWPPHLPREIIPGAVSIQWIEETRIAKHEDSPFWQSRVNAEFPFDDTEGIILLSLLKAGRQRYDADPDRWNNLASRYPWRFGLDVADGVDNHALACWKGPVLYSVEIHPTKGDGEDVPRAAALLLRKLNSYGNALAAVDNTGVGAGALGICRQAGYMVRGCKFGAEAKGEADRQFYNRKIELYWQFREGLRLGNLAIAPLENEEYVFADLSATRYKIMGGGQLCCEPKSETRKRLKRSPDAEAAVIALENGLDMGGVVGPEGVYVPEPEEPENDLAALKRLFPT